VRLLPYFASAGFKVTFLLDREGGELMEPVRQAGGHIVSLGANRQVSALPKLVKFLKKENPHILISNMEHMNVMAILASKLARVRTRIVVTQHNTFSEQVKRPSWQFRILPLLYRLTMPLAGGIVAVSAGVAQDLSARCGLKQSSIKVIYNGVVTDDFQQRASGTPDHPWFSDNVPVVLAMGRLVEQKDFATLIQAFAEAAEQSLARLIILGEGPLRPKLETLVRRLNMADRIALPGFTENALAYLSRSRLFVLSSRFEGFGNVVAEALACGTPVVSTDCPHGPAEILDHGRYGTLVPVGDAPALAKAILSSLGEPRLPQILQARGAIFRVDACAQSYIEMVR
jgi:glycosyltransferase involved in cell wall biosynthesis